ncbi:hypothetical protein AB0H36_05125 [Kribbella sp. NPDC050820]|uniref:hypothetical protein n=1 Tax=Kribbella sp. NPDC050820 TaxID=3155408 RepID=UPI0033DB78D2
MNEKGQEYFTAPISGSISPAGDPNRYIRSTSGGPGGGAISAGSVVEVHQHITMNGIDPAHADLIASRVMAKAELAARSY